MSNICLWDVQISHMLATNLYKNLIEGLLQKRRHIYSLACQKNPNLSGASGFYFRSDPYCLTVYRPPVGQRLKNLRLVMLPVTLDKTEVDSWFQEENTFKDEKWFVVTSYFMGILRYSLSEETLFQHIPKVLWYSEHSKSIQEILKRNRAIFKGREPMARYGLQPYLEHSAYQKVREDIQVQLLENMISSV